MSLAARSISSLAVLALVTACGPSSPKGESTAPTVSTAQSGPASGPTTGEPVATATTAAPTAPPPGGPAPISLPGKWSSPSCGARKYLRELELQRSGRFQSDDLVSPCPANVACVWSGIVHREGTWTDASQTLKLVVDKDGSGPAVAALPASLELTGSELIEAQGSERCSYRKK